MLALVGRFLLPVFRSCPAWNGPFGRRPLAVLSLRGIGATRRCGAMRAMVALGPVVSGCAR